MSPGVDPVDPGIPTISIPDVRDYQRINAELIQHLDAGHRLVRLAGAEGQRLLASGLVGHWDAVVEVLGFAGPELAAGLNAPGLTVLCQGSAADGAGSCLKNGSLIVRGDAGPAAGYAQAGGTIVVAGASGPRAGLNQSGGVLALLGPIGPLAGERQSGGRLFVASVSPARHWSRGQSGGRVISLANLDRTDSDDLALFREVSNAYQIQIQAR